MQVQLSACPECFGFKQAFFGSEYCQDHNKLQELACSQPACRVFKAISVDLCTWTSAPSPLSVFFYGKEWWRGGEFVCEWDSLHLPFPPVTLSLYICVCGGLCVWYRAEQLRGNTAHILILLHPLSSRRHVSPPPLLSVIDSNRQL